MFTHEKYVTSTLYNAVKDAVGERLLRALHIIQKNDDNTIIQNGLLVHICTNQALKDNIMTYNMSNEQYSERCANDVIDELYETLGTLDLINVTFRDIQSTKLDMLRHIESLKFDMRFYTTLEQDLKTA